MTVEERAELYQTAVDVAQGHTIVAGVAAVRTRDAVLLAKAAKKAGVAGIMLGLPPYVKPTETEVEQYCNAVLEHVKDVPVLLCKFGKQQRYFFTNKKTAKVKLKSIR